MRILHPIVVPGADVSAPNIDYAWGQMVRRGYCISQRMWPRQLSWPCPVSRICRAPGRGRKQSFPGDQNGPAAIEIVIHGSMRPRVRSSSWLLIRGSLQTWWLQCIRHLPYIAPRSLLHLPRASQTTEQLHSSVVLRIRLLITRKRKIKRKISRVVSDDEWEHLSFKLHTCQKCFLYFPQARNYHDPNDRRPWLTQTTRHSLFRIKSGGPGWPALPLE